MSKKLNLDKLVKPQWAITDQWQTMQLYYSDRGFTVAETIFRKYSEEDSRIPERIYDGTNPELDDLELLEFFDRQKWGTL